ncbi:MAG: recombinase family protein, partial [Desulfuromonadales bacterium]|nr:recombinase family protein [Desulfuromonadales bacterium]NIS40621.1 recombinase family protein [Desulfuromonadales bacterium]
GRRVPAGDLEALVEERLRTFLASEAKFFAAIEPHITDMTECTELVGRAADLARRWSGHAPAEKRAILLGLVDRIDFLRETLEIRILPCRLPTILGAEHDPLDWTQPKEEGAPIITWTVPARLRRTGLETRLLIDGAGGGPRKTPDHSLYRLLAQAYRYRAMVMQGSGKTMAELAAEAGVTGSWFTRILRLSFL